MKGFVYFIGYFFMAQFRHGAYYDNALDFNGGVALKIKNVFVCGGDARSIYMAEYFAGQGYSVTTFGIGGQNEDFDGIKSAGIVALGLPAVKEGNVYMPLSDCSLPFGELLNNCCPGTVVCGGRFNRQDYCMAEDAKVTLMDYSEDEIFCTENALYTAEGALAELIKSGPCSLLHTRVLIVGYGRIGRALCNIMQSRVYSITVYARRQESRTVCEVSGIATIEDPAEAGRFDAIINTVPANILTSDILASVRKDCLVMDLSARPGYVDKELCNANGLKLLYLPGIPLKSAPKSAGISAAKAIERY